MAAPSARAGGEEGPAPFRRRVALIHSDEDTPETVDRAKMVFALIGSLGLVPRMAICEEAPVATVADLLNYHCREYISVFEAAACSERDDDSFDEEVLERHGLAFDAALFPGVWKHATRIAGGSLRAAELLQSGECDVALHWQGGRHHATADRAAGFCYLNDVVLAALRLLRTYKAVVVLDFDIHHGDGTESAFAHSAAVLNVSLHQHAPGFYPGTGALADRGSGRGLNATVNVPLRPGCGSRTFRRVVTEVTSMCREWIDARSCAVIVQCGADGLAGDPRGGFNLQPADLAAALGSVLEMGLPTLVLGGGGYVQANAARAWALCSMRALGLPEPASDAQIPDADPFYDRYRQGSFMLTAMGASAASDEAESAHAPRTHDQNDEPYLSQLLDVIRARFAELQRTAGMRGVKRSLPTEALPILARADKASSVMAESA
jgi:histone deacetylase 8